MGTSRRNFLKNGTIGLLCAGMPAVLAKVVVGRSITMAGFSGENTKRLAGFTKDAFAPYVNTNFRIKTNSGTVDLRLSKITDLKAVSKIPARIAGKESFSLLFVSSSKAPFLEQETYVFEHQALGSFSLFLVPVGKASNRHHEAIIIRL